MPGAQGIKAGGAFYQLGTDNSPLQKGLKQAESMVKAWGARVASLGKKIGTSFGLLTAGGIAGLAAAGKVFGDMGGELVDLSDKTGIGTDALQELGYAAQQTGADLGTVETGVKKMQDTIAQAAAGNKTAADALGKLGVKVSDLAGLTPEEQFAKLADGISKIENPAARTAAVLDVFGKSGTDLLPMMQDGAAGLQKYADEARSLGLVMDEATLRAADDFGDSIGVVEKQVKGAAASLAATFLPIMQKFVKISQTVIAGVIEWVQQNKGLVLAVGAAVAAIAAASVGLIVLGKAIAIVGAMIGLFTTVVGAASALATAISGLPIGIALVAAGLTAAVAAGAYWLAVSGKMTKAIDWLKAKFLELKDDVLEAWGGIKDALEAGDIGLAMQIVGALIKLEWTKAIGFLQDKWLDFKYFAMETAVSIGEAIASAFIRAFASVRKGISTVRGALEKMAVRGKEAFTAILEGRAPRSTAAAERSIDRRTQSRNKLIDESATRQSGIARTLINAVAGMLPGRKAAEVAAAGDRGVGVMQALFDALVEKAKQLKEQGAGEGGGKKPKKPVAELETVGHEMEERAASQHKSHGEAGALGAVDVRTAEGFSAVMASLRAANPDLQAQMYALQQREFEELRRIRISEEKTKVRTANAI